MAVQPVHRTREQLMTEALGERLPVTMSGNFTLYRRSKSKTLLYVHDRRKGAESLPVATFVAPPGGWGESVPGDTAWRQDPIEEFRKWVGRHP